MSVGNRQYMRIIVFFDLPTKTKKNKRNYVQFRRFLLNDGYDMIQFSVYSRIIVGKDAKMAHYDRIKRNLPPEGSIRCMTVTEKQYSEIEILVGKRTIQEERIGGVQLLLF